MIVTMNASIWVSISGLALYVAVWGFAQWQHRATKKMTQVRKATGSCRVAFEPKDFGDTIISGMREFHGALEGASRREALDIPDREARPGYLHIERVVGTLDGRSGTFLLAYSGIKDDATSFTVVPGSGTGALNGIGGTMTIRIRAGQQVYDFEYTLNTPAARVTFSPESGQAISDEQKGNIGRVFRTVVAAISVLANQQVAVQRAGACVLHVHRIVLR